MTLIFRKIQVEHADSRNTFNDDWLSGLTFLLPEETRDAWEKAFTRWTTTDFGTDGAADRLKAVIAGDSKAK